MIGSIVFYGLVTVGVAFGLSSLSDLTSLVFGLFGRRKAPEGEAKKLLVLVPAHDEEVVIERTLRSLGACVARVDSPVEIVVVADNCTDRTPEIAREHGATVLERHDPQHPGKHRALHWALGELGVDGEVDVAIVDADLVLEDRFFETIVAQGPWTGRVGQPRHRVHPESAATRLGVVSSVLVDARYRAGIPLKRRAGLNAPVTGAAFVIGGDVAREVPWTELGPAEDLEIYAWMSARGGVVEYIGDTYLYFETEPSLERSQNQRRRWAGGRWRAALAYTPTVVFGRASLRQKLDALGELWTPGPVEHALITGVLAAVAFLAMPLERAWIVWTVLGFGIARPVVYTVVGVTLQPSPVRAAAGLLYLPFYAVWRAWILLTSLPVAIRGNWSKTPRQ